MNNRQKIGIVILIIAIAVLYYLYSNSTGDNDVSLPDVQVPITTPSQSSVVGNGSLFVPPPAVDERPVEEIKKTLAKYSLIGVTGYSPLTGGMTAREVVSLSKCQNSCSMDSKCTGIMYSMPNDSEYPQGSCFTINIPIDSIPLAPDNVSKADKEKYARILYKRV